MPPNGLRSPFSLRQLIFFVTWNAIQFAFFAYHASLYYRGVQDTAPVSVWGFYVYNFGLTALSSTLTLKDVSIANVMSFSKSEEMGYGGIAVVDTTVKAERLVVRDSENVGIGGWSGSVFPSTGS